MTGQSTANPDGASVIEARGLVRRFGSFVAVDGVDVAIARGEVFGLLGANGAGKTTIIRMLCGALKPSVTRPAAAPTPFTRSAPERPAACAGVTSR